MANTAIEVVNLDFDEIKQGLKNYIAGKEEFLDYNFEGSVINLLLDILSYNTYQNAYYTSMVGNEMFLDSAQLRESIVSRAKMIGYVPRSARGASTSLDVTINPDNTPNSITIDKGTEFSAVVDGRTFTFSTPESYVIIPEDGVYSTSIVIREGIPVTHRFNVNTANPIRYVIPNANVDTTSLTVRVQNSSSDSTSETFTLAEDITTVGSNSPVYFIQEVENGYYELYFGDGVIGKSLSNGNIIIVEYRITNALDGNDISDFTGPDTLGGYSSYTFTVNASTSGGAVQETDESIKFNAPKSFETQKRAVIDADYERIILENNGDIQSIRVWGGETNEPPVYGKVFIAVKPTASNILSDQRKDDILNLLNRYKILSTTIEFIDPTYIYIKPDITVTYDSRKTTLTSNQVREKVIKAIQNFETTKLGTFENSNFRFSNFSTMIDNSDPSILGNYTSIKLEKRFTPNFNTSTKYVLNFNTTLENIAEGFASLSGIPANHPGGGVVITSSAFSYQGRTCYLDDDGFGNVRVFYYQNGNIKTYLNRNQGTIDYGTGIITLNSFAPTSATGNEIRVQVKPRTNDLETEKYQLMLLGGFEITMSDFANKNRTTSVTVSTTGSVTQINESAVGTII